MLQDDDTKNAFFSKVDDNYIFLQTKFIEFFSKTRYLSNSYTKYANKIGLCDFEELKLLKSMSDVVLNFPYKDCVLEGGLSKTETDGKKTKSTSEVMLNDIIAHNDINKLYSAKAFTNIKKHNKEKPNGFIPDTISDNENLVIKGNNLLALHSLKQKYMGKVKLIYIDPPYNTGNDDFSYNDNFNHSTWLVFMKNRLEIARQLLRDDGVIFVQCDDNEQAYLKVLMDEIFGRENFIGCLVWRKTGQQQNNGENIATSHEYILVYSKIYNSIVIKRDKIEDRDGIKAYSNKDEIGQFRVNPIQHGILGKKTFKLQHPLTGKIIESNKSLKTTDEIIELDKQGLIYWGKKGNETLPQVKKYLNNHQGVIVNSMILDIFNESNIEEQKKLFDKKVFDNPKPEALIERIINISTQEGDLVLDFFAGSGTTAAVAHKMNRRFITIEQLDSHVDICQKRLAKVISGDDQGGISKKHNWQGGGDYLFLEMAKYNLTWQDKLEKSTTTAELEELYKEMLDKSVISYRVLQNANVFTDTDFLALPFDDKKAILIATLDKNFCYVPYHDCTSNEFELDQKTIKLNHIFYGVEK